MKRVVIAVASIVALALLVMTSPAAANQQWTPGDRRHCDTRTTQTPIPTFSYMVVNPASYVGDIDAPVGTKIRVIAWDWGIGEWNGDQPGIMYSVDSVGAPFRPSAEPWTNLWVMERTGIEVTPQFERCVARLPIHTFRG